MGTEPHERLRDRLAAALAAGTLDWAALRDALAAFESASGPDADYDLADALWHTEDDCSRGWITDAQMRERVAAVLDAAADGGE